MDLKTTIEIVKNVVEIIAVPVAALWTYALFVRGRWNSLRGEFVHRDITHIDLGSGKRLVTVVIQGKNKGNVALRPWKTRGSIQQILPLTGPAGDDISAGRNPVQEDGEIAWELAGKGAKSEGEHEVEFGQKEEAIIEPGETMIFQCDFVIDSSITVVQIHTMVHCDLRNRDQAWEDVSIVRLPQMAESASTRGNTKT